MMLKAGLAQCHCLGVSSAAGLAGLSIVLAGPYGFIRTDSGETPGPFSSGLTIGDSPESAMLSLMYLEEGVVSLDWTQLNCSRRVSLARPNPGLMMPGSGNDTKPHMQVTAFIYFVGLHGCSTTCQADVVVGSKLCPPHVRQQPRYQGGH